MAAFCNIGKCDLLHNVKMEIKEQPKNVWILEMKCGRVVQCIEVPLKGTQGPFPMIIVLDALTLFARSQL